jgi:hypothetical protein
MATIKSLKPRLLTTTLDVIRLAPGITKDVNITNDDRTNYTEAVDIVDVEAKLLEAKGIVLLHLQQIYSESSLRTTPWAGIPTKDYSNSGTGKLWAATASTTAYTELWTLAFTGTTTFTIEGSSSGSQGTGSTGATATSTNGDLALESGMWTGTHVSGDTFYCPVYDVYPEVKDVSAKLAAAYCLQEIYTEDVPNEQSLSRKYEMQALNYLKRAGDPERTDAMFIGGQASSLDLEPLAVEYYIDSDGIDQSVYYPDYREQDDNEGT